jgi:hypothetical protein
MSVSPKFPLPPSVILALEAANASGYLANIQLLGHAIVKFNEDPHVRALGESMALRSQEIVKSFSCFIEIAGQCGMLGVKVPETMMKTLFPEYYRDYLAGFDDGQDRRKEDAAQEREEARLHD